MTDAAVRLQFTASLSHFTFHPYTTQLQFDAESNFTLEAAIRWRSGDGNTGVYEADPANFAERAGLAAALPFESTAEVTVLHSGEVRISWDQGAQLRCGPGDGYEAWSLHTQSSLVVSLPNGGLAEWGGHLTT